MANWRFINSNSETFTFSFSGSDSREIKEVYNSNSGKWEYQTPTESEKTETQVSNISGVQQISSQDYADYIQNISDFLNKVPGSRPPGPRP